MEDCTLLPTGALGGGDLSCWLPLLNTRHSTYTLNQTQCQHCYTPLLRVVSAVSLRSLAITTATTIHTVSVQHHPAIITYTIFATEPPQGSLDVPARCCRLDRRVGTTISTICGFDWSIAGPSSLVTSALNRYTAHQRKENQRGCKYNSWLFLPLARSNLPRFYRLARIAADFQHHTTADNTTIMIPQKATSRTVAGWQCSENNFPRVINAHLSSWAPPTAKISREYRGLRTSAELRRRPVGPVVLVGATALQHPITSHDKAEARGPLLWVLSCNLLYAASVLAALISAGRSGSAATDGDRFLRQVPTDTHTSPINIAASCSVDAYSRKASFTVFWSLRQAPSNQHTQWTY